MAPVVSGIAVFFAYASLFALVQAYPAINEAVGAAATCYLLGFFCLALAAVALVWLPETNRYKRLLLLSIACKMYSCSERNLLRLRDTIGW